MFWGSWRRYSSWFEYKLTLKCGKLGIKQLILCVFQPLPCFYIWHCVRLFFDTVWKTNLDKTESGSASIRKKLMTSHSTRTLLFVSLGFNFYYRRFSMLKKKYGEFSTSEPSASIPRLLENPRMSGLPNLAASAHPKVSCSKTLAISFGTRGARLCLGSCLPDDHDAVFVEYHMCHPSNIWKKNMFSYFFSSGNFGRRLQPLAPGNRHRSAVPPLLQGQAFRSHLSRCRDAPLTTRGLGGMPSCEKQLP